MHSSCQDLSWTGDANAPALGEPCNHLFTANLGAFIYTPAVALASAADGAFCCRTYKATSTQLPGAVPRNWTQSLLYKVRYNGQGDVARCF